MEGDDTYGSDEEDDDDDDAAGAFGPDAPPFLPVTESDTKDQLGLPDAYIGESQAIGDDGDKYRFKFWKRTRETYDLQACGGVWRVEAAV